jgi:hypothetical protein
MKSLHSMCAVCSGGRCSSAGYKSELCGVEHGQGCCRYIDNGGGEICRCGHVHVFPGVRQQLRGWRKRRSGYRRLLVAGRGLESKLRRLKPCSARFSNLSPSMQPERVWKRIIDDGMPSTSPENVRLESFDGVLCCQPPLTRAGCARATAELSRILQMPALRSMAYQNVSSATARDVEGKTTSTMAANTLFMAPSLRMNGGRFRTLKTPAFLRLWTHWTHLRPTISNKGSFPNQFVPKEASEVARH